MSSGACGTTFCSFSPLGKSSFKRNRSEFSSNRRSCLHNRLPGLHNRHLGVLGRPRNMRRILVWSDSGRMRASPTEKSCTKSFHMPLKTSRPSTCNIPVVQPGHVLPPCSQPPLPDLTPGRAWLRPPSPLARFSLPGLAWDRGPRTLKL